MKNITLERVVRTLLAILTVGVVIVIMQPRNFGCFSNFSKDFSYVLDPTVNRLQRMGVQRTLGVTLTLSVIIMAIVFFSTNIALILLKKCLNLQII